MLDWTGNALNRVDRLAFFAAFDEGLAVQYIYEPFLRVVIEGWRRHCNTIRPHSSLGYGPRPRGDAMADVATPTM